ncbi:MAG TPA: UDP-N-acetylglucosamine--N-acetylmuramyl-(pentapeptide) pyrophosphoryl-undecaprenol N-acetylglucosamine transferase [Tepidisphaeraceae bacterium]
MPEPKTILLAGGGTGGHLYPGIAVAEALRDVASGLKPVFLCTTKEIDRVILEPTGFEFIPQPIVPWKKSIGGTLRFAKQFGETWDLVRKVLKERKPAAVLGLGGYAAGLAVKLAARMKIPTALINPDVIPGEANRLLMKQAVAVCCQFSQTAEHVDAPIRPKLKVTGCPIRSDIRHLPPRAEAAARLSLDPMLNTLVVTGASLGAKTINEAVLTMLDGVTLRGWQILHLSGREHAPEVRAGYRDLSTPAVVIDFTPAMADIWAVADLAISRSGASSCAELTATGVPSILFPYPFHKDMHQQANAKVLADAGAAILLDDEKDRKRNAEKLRPAVESLLYDVDKRRAMSDAARKLGKPQAAKNVAHLITETVGMSR